MRDAVWLGSDAGSGVRRTPNALRCLAVYCGPDANALRCLLFFVFEENGHIA
jgi:hypothetical protein